LASRPRCAAVRHQPSNARCVRERARSSAGGDSLACLRCTMPSSAKARRWSSRPGFAAGEGVSNIFSGSLSAFARFQMSFGPNPVLQSSDARGKRCSRGFCVVCSNGGVHLHRPATQDKRSCRGVQSNGNQACEKDRASDSQSLWSLRSCPGADRRTLSLSDAPTGPWLPAHAPGDADN